MKLNGEICHAVMSYVVYDTTLYSIPLKRNRKRFFLQPIYPGLDGILEWENNILVAWFFSVIYNNCKHSQIKKKKILIPLWIKPFEWLIFCLSWLITTKRGEGIIRPLMLTFKINNKNLKSATAKMMVLRIGPDALIQAKYRPLLGLI